MTPDLVAALDASLAATLAHVGTSADYRLGGGTVAPLLLVVNVTELADDYVQRRYGHDKVRVADVLLRRASLAGGVPAHGDTATIVDGPHAGVWTVLGIESRDDVAIVVRVRRSDRLDSASPTARDIRR
jgi:hypothetical protein